MNSKIKKYTTKKYFFFWISLGTIILVNILATPVWAQLPLLPELNLETLKPDRSADTRISACVHLDGHCVFELSDQKSTLGQRIKYAESQLSSIKDIYLKSNHTRLNVSTQGNRDRQSLDVVIGKTNIPVVTLDSNDLEVRGVDLETHAGQIANKIESGLEKAREERRSPFLLEQARLAGVVLLLVVLINFILFRHLERLNQAKAILSKNSPSLSSQLEQRKTLNLKEVQYRFLQLT